MTADRLTVAQVIHSLGSGGAEALLVELARVAPRRESAWWWSALRCSIRHRRG